MREYFYRLATDRANKPWDCVLKIFLWLVSFLYGFAVGVRSRLYRWSVFKSCRLNRPVISIGNITWGGVGKTPFVELLARFLQERKIKPVILTRGYGSQSSEAADEALLLRRSLGPDVPIVAGKDRVQSAEKAIKFQPDVFILDDGFQHWRVQRDLDVVLIDCVNPFGNRQLIPRGSLREPLNGLKRADILVLTKTDRAQGSLRGLYEDLHRRNAKALIVESVHKPTGFIDLKSQERLPLDRLSGYKCAAFCGIGEPESFQSSLESLGVKVEKFFVFMDHHVYCREDLQAITDFCRANQISMVITTAKDAVKLNEFFSIFEGLSILSLEIELTLTKGQHELFDRISRLLER